MKINKKGLNSIKQLKVHPSRYISLGVLVFLVLSLLGNISRIKEVGLKIEKEEERVHKLQKENEELRKNLEITKSEEFIEKQLRDNLGLAKDGEIVVILPDAETVKKFAPREDEDEQITLNPNWKKWLELFF